MKMMAKKMRKIAPTMELKMKEGVKMQQMPMTKDSPRPKRMPKLNLTPAQLGAIRKSPAGQLPKFLEVGNKKAGASLLRTKDGAEIQAGIGRVHVGAGYSKSNKSAGIDVSRTNRRGKTKSVGASIRFK